MPDLTRLTPLHTTLHSKRRKFKRSKRMDKLVSSGILEKVFFSSDPAFYILKLKSNCKTISRKSKHNNIQLLVKPRWNVMKVRKAQITNFTLSKVQLNFAPGNLKPIFRILSLEMFYLQMVFFYRTAKNDTNFVCRLSRFLLTLFWK